jgi:hypothetical protein
MPTKLDMSSPTHELSNRKWIALASHRTWLLGQADALGSWGKPKSFFSFFERRLINPLGGFYDLNEQGRPTNSVQVRCGGQARPVPFSRPQELFTLTPSLIPWVGQAQTSSLITELGRVDEFSTDDVFGIPRLNGA